MEEDGPLGVSHDASTPQVAQGISPAAHVKAGPPLTPLQHLQGFLDGVKPTNSQIPPVQALNPGALVALIGDKAHAYLGDGDRQGVVHHAGAVAGLNGAVE